MQYLTDAVETCFEITNKQKNWILFRLIGVHEMKRIFFYKIDILEQNLISNHKYASKTRLKFYHTHARMLKVVKQLFVALKKKSCDFFFSLKNISNHNCIIKHVVFFFV